MPLAEGTDVVRMIASTLGVLAAVVGAAVLYGASRWRKQTERLHERLHAGRRPMAHLTYDGVSSRACLCQSNATFGPC